MAPQVLVANAGSSSLKFALFNKNGTNQTIADASGQLEGIGIQPRFTVKDAAAVTPGVLPTNENLMIARHTLNQVMLSAGGRVATDLPSPKLLKIRTRKSFP